MTVDHVVLTLISNEEGLMDECLIHLRLVGEQATAFIELCAREHRKPAMQVKHMIAQAIDHRGFDRMAARMIAATDWSKRGKNEPETT